MYVCGGVFACLHPTHFFIFHPLKQHMYSLVPNHKPERTMWAEWWEQVSCFHQVPRGLANSTGVQIINVLKMCVCVPFRLIIHRGHHSRSHLFGRFYSGYSSWRNPQIQCFPFLQPASRSRAAKLLTLEWMDNHCTNWATAAPYIPEKLLC